MPAREDTRDALIAGHTVLGIELGSTRIKACLVDAGGTPVASGEYSWESRLVDGRWTYALDDVWQGLRQCYAAVVADAERRYGVRPVTYRALGVSAMMHGYLAFDAAGELLVDFRTWRNTSTGPAAAELSTLFGYNIPLRWSVAHLYQAILDREPHVEQVRFLTTLAGYVHWRLTGRRVLGVGDASGMFPIDPATRTYDATMLERFDRLVAGQRDDAATAPSDVAPTAPSADAATAPSADPAATAPRLGQRLEQLLPEVLVAGQDAGTLTAQGALLLDPTGQLRPGIALCPPEGDAGTGMVATHAVAPRTGNVSVGTSVFAMAVLGKPLEQVHPELDLVTTPAGDLVAMVHCNNGASELDAWAGLFRRFAELLGRPAGTDEVFAVLLREALTGDGDAGGLTAYNYLSGEPVTGLTEGRPLLVRAPDARFTLANLVRAQIYGAFGALSLGMRVLRTEGVEIDAMVAHGGLFRTPGVAQRLLAAALNVPVAVGEAAGEGGAWGIAILASYLGDGADRGRRRSLAEYLDEHVFAGADPSVVEPDAGNVRGFATFLERYTAGLAVEQAAVESL